MKNLSLKLALNLGHLICLNRKHSFFRLLDASAGKFHRQYENLNYRFESNGELRVLKVLKELEINCIFDVGAHRGEWTKLAAELFPNSYIHAFEIAPPTFYKLKEITKNIPNLTLNSSGLSNKEGKISLKYADYADGLSTGVEFTCELEGQQIIEVDVKTGDSYCFNNGLSKIDFLKIDVEGMEGKVLEGFSKMISDRRIRMIQFEYGKVNIISHFLLKDFYDLLTQWGYCIGKIYPSYVDFREYKWCNEDFIGPNYLAVLKNETEVIKLLQ